jgi:hypothetical protein
VWGVGVGCRSTCGVWEREWRRGEAEAEAE